MMSYKIRDDDGVGYDVPGKKAFRSVYRPTKGCKQALLHKSNCLGHLVIEDQSVDGNGVPGAGCCPRSSICSIELESIACMS